jgi:hypothetical protein
MKKQELSLCKFCNCMTKTISKSALSGSENEKFRYECGKCGALKERCINNENILCRCGHSLDEHSPMTKQCYIIRTKTERVKNHFGKYIKIICHYGCTCKCFEEWK